MTWISTVRETPLAAIRASRASTEKSPSGTLAPGANGKRSSRFQAWTWESISRGGGLNEEAAAALTSVPATKRRRFMGFLGVTRCSGRQADSSASPRNDKQRKDLLASDGEGLGEGEGEGGFGGQLGLAVLLEPDHGADACAYSCADQGSRDAADDCSCGCAGTGGEGQGGGGLGGVIAADDGALVIDLHLFVEAGVVS